LTVARLADADAWRQQLRDPATRGNREALERLANRPEAATQPPLSLVHLGKYLAQAGSWTASAELLERAQRRHPADFWVNYALGMSLSEQKPPRTDKAVGFFRAALAIRPQSRIAHLLLAKQLLRQAHTAEALAHFRRYDELSGSTDPRATLVLADFGRKSLQEGDFAAAAAQLKMAFELHGLKDLRGQQLTDLARTAERMAQLETKLPAFLSGEAKPAGAEERILLAQICPHKKLYAASARFYVEAFAAQPKLANDVLQMHRYQAARAAAMAGTGQGEDAAKLDDTARAEWRNHARKWLQSDLAFFEQAVRGGQPQTRVAVRQLLQRWRSEPDLAGIRDAAALAKLPPEEQDAFRKLWGRVDGLIRTSGGAGAPGG
jgi:tetratricopeptide (TPR) repeat protein